MSFQQQNSGSRHFPYKTFSETLSLVVISLVSEVMHHQPCKLSHPHSHLASVHISDLFRTHHAIQNYRNEAKSAITLQSPNLLHAPFNFQVCYDLD